MTAAELLQAVESIREDAQTRLLKIRAQIQDLEAQIQDLETEADQLQELIDG